MSLIVTIIILLILAGITLGSIFGKNGIIGMARKAVQNYTEAQQEEQKELENLYSTMYIATNDDSKIVINIEDLNKVIDERVEKKIDNLGRLNNPKELLCVKLPYSGSEKRAIGIYKASNSFTHTATANYEKYLVQNEDKTWKVLQSGWYLINNVTRGYGTETEKWTYINDTLWISGTEMRIGSSQARPEEGFANNNGSVTVYLKEGTILDFLTSIGGASAAYHESNFTIYAMCE